MEIRWLPYKEVSAAWPRQGRHILATFSADEIVVYQAYRAEIADVAVARQRFDQPFSLQRMSWIKPNFLWMMYRSGWAGKPDQERVLAVHLPLARFHGLLAAAVWSTWQPHLHATSEAWSEAVGAGEVRLQWDPDHGPRGNPVERRAIQLGMRGGVLRDYALAWPLRIEDITEQVHAQQRRIDAPETLLVPDERPLPVADPVVRQRLRLD